MIDTLDASDDRLRLAVARALSSYGEDELFDCLTDPDPILRTTAARILHTRGTRTVFDHVIGLADHPRRDMREIAAFVLGQLGLTGRPYARPSYPVLARLLDDPYWEVRRAAAGAVGTLAEALQPPEGLRDRLFALATDDKADVRTAIAAALGSVDDPRTEACLARLADDDDPVVRDDAEFSLELREELKGDEAAHPASAEAAE